MKNAVKRATELSPTMLKLSDIEIRPDMQVRVELDQDTVDEYAQHLDDGGELEPIHVFENDPPKNGDAPKPPVFAVDAHHRIGAYLKAERTKIPAFIHRGEEFEALEMAIQRNCHHGLRMGRQDKYKAVKMAIENAVLRRKSNKYLAQLCGVSPTFIARFREGKIRITGSGPRKKSARAPKEPVTTAGDPGAHDQTDVEAADERMDNVATWLKTGLCDPPMLLNVLNKSKKFRFVMIPRTDLKIVVMQGGAFLKEMSVEELMVREGKIEITIPADGEEAPV